MNSSKFLVPVCEPQSLQCFYLQQLHEFSKEKQKVCIQCKKHLPDKFQVLTPQYKVFRVFQSKSYQISEHMIILRLMLVTFNNRLQYQLCL